MRMQCPGEGGWERGAQYLGQRPSNKCVEGGPMKDMAKSPSDGKQETVKGQGKK